MAIPSEIEKLERRWNENPTGLTFTPLAEAYRKAGLGSRALEVLEAGLAVHPDYVPALIVRGRCHLDADRHAEAEEALQHALTRDPVNAIALRSLAEVYERTGRVEAAIGRLEFLLEIDGRDADARLHLQRLRAGSPVVAPDSAPIATEAGPAAPPPQVDLLSTEAATPGAESPAPPLGADEPSSMDADQDPDLGWEPSTIRWEDVAAPAQAPAEQSPAAESGIGIENLSIDPIAEPESMTEESAHLTLEASNEQELMFEPLLPAPEGPMMEAPQDEPVMAELPDPIPEESDATPVEAQAVGRAEEFPVEDDSPVAAPEFTDEVTSEHSTDDSAETMRLGETEEPDETEEPEEPEASDEVLAEEPSLIVTASMAELFLRQGHRELALAVYRQLQERHPERQELVDAVTRLESTDDAPATTSGSPVYAAAVTGGESVEAFLQRILQQPPPAASATVLPPAIEASLDGAPTRDASDALTLGVVFGDEPSVAPKAESASDEAAVAAGPSYDEFFGTAAPPPDTPVTSTGGDGDDLHQFNEWLKGLKR